MSLSTSLIVRLQHQHETIPELIQGFSEADLQLSLQPGKWNAWQQVAHLAVYQPVFIQRLHAITQQNNPSFERYSSDADPVFLQLTQQTMPVILATIAKERTTIIQFITTLPEEITQRTGQHPLYGSLTLAQWTEFFLLHEAHHLFRLLLLTRALHQHLQTF